MVSYLSFLPVFILQKLWLTFFHMICITKKKKIGTRIFFQLLLPTAGIFIAPIGSEVEKFVRQPSNKFCKKLPKKQRRAECGRKFRAKKFQHPLKKIWWSCVGAHGHWFQRKTSVSYSECSKNLLKISTFPNRYILKLFQKFKENFFKNFLSQNSLLHMIIFLTFTWNFWLHSCS